MVFSCSAELSVALNFVLSYLYNKLPRRRVDCFAGLLETKLREKLQTDWVRSTASIFKVTGVEVDAEIMTASEQSGLGSQEVQAYLPEGLVLSIEPNAVVYWVAGQLDPKVLYSGGAVADDGYGSGGSTPGNVSPTIEAAQCQLAAQLARVNLSEQQTNAWLMYKMREAATPTYSTAEFIAMKFGSTKFRTPAKPRRPRRTASHLSPGMQQPQHFEPSRAQQYELALQQPRQQPRQQAQFYQPMLPQQHLHPTPSDRWIQQPAEHCPPSVNPWTPHAPKSFYESSPFDPWLNCAALPEQQTSASTATINEEDCFMPDISLLPSYMQHMLTAN